MHPFTCLLALVVINHSVSAQPGPPEPTRWNNPERQAFPGLVHGSFASSAMNTDVGYNVYLPKDYEESQARYPLVLFLHGSGGDENSDAAAFAGVVAELIATRQIPPVLCAFPNGGRRSGYRDNPATGENVETMIVRELIPLLDATYRTLPDPASRVVTGFSMGGAGAVRLAAKYPELFSGAGSWGGAFAGRHNDRLAAEFTADALAPIAGRARLVLIVGTKDFILQGHALMVASLIEAQVPHTFELLHDVEHDPGAYVRLTGGRVLHDLLTQARSNAAPTP